MSKLYMVTTPRHVLISAALALADESRSQDHHIIFFDQLRRENPLFEAINAWKESPFKTAQLFYRPEKGLFKKLRQRRETHKRLLALSSQLAPEQLFIGDDRRVEFQYLFHHLAKGNSRLRAAYMDDGTGSYVDRTKVLAKRTWHEKLIDRPVKKLVYGSFYDHRGNLGATRFLDNAYVAFPDLVHEYLKHKNLLPLRPEMFEHPALKAYGSLLSGTHDSGESYRDIDVVFILPHSPMMDDAYGSKEKLLHVVDSLYQTGKKVAVKYHPREEGDVLNLEGKAEFLPALMPFELLLPLLSEPVIIGDVSTALVSAKWLKPDAKVVSLYNPTFMRAQHLIDLFDRLNIVRVENIAEVLTCQ